LGPGLEQQGDDLFNLIMKSYGEVFFGVVSSEDRYLCKSASNYIKPRGVNLMRLPSWKPGLKGLIYLPEENTLPRQKNRPYHIYEINEQGELTWRAGPMSWTDANNEVQKLAAQENKQAFACPITDTYDKLVKQGYLKIKS
jgi:hypothetical protein